MELSVDRSRALALVGVLALALALLLGATDLTRSLVALLGNDYFLVALVAGFGVLVALATLYAGRPSALRQARMPEPERPRAVRPFGDEFDDALADPRLDVPVLGRAQRADLHATLRDLAASTVARVDGCRREVARERLDGGTWTDDPVAAAFLRGDAPSPPLSAALPAVVAGRSWYGRRVERTAAALAALAAEGR